MAIIDPKQKENLPLLSEVMQIDFKDDEEILEFVYLKMCPSHVRKDVYFDTLMANNYLTRVDRNLRYLTLMGNERAEYYAPPLLSKDFLECETAGAYVQKLVEFTQVVVTQIFENGTIERCLLWALEEWCFFVSRLDLGRLSKEVRVGDYPGWDGGDSAGELLNVDEQLKQEPRLSELKAPHELISIEFAFSTSSEEGWLTPEELIQEICLSIIRLQKQRHLLRRCASCGNIFIRNPIKSKQIYCSPNCSARYRVAKMRGQITTK